MHGQYGRIAEIEKKWGIRFREGDMRPRIEYFHDAVRALISGEVDLYAKHSRLSIEHLAYDVAQLRKIQAKPGGSISKASELSAEDALATQDDVKYRSCRGPDRAAKRELAELYKDYTVLFTALFVETADMNYQVRCDEIDETVQDIGTIENILDKLVNGNLTMDQAMDMLDHIEHDQLHDMIVQAIQGQTIRHAEQEAITERLQAFQGHLDAEKATIEQAHTNYAMGQLAVYEQSKETVKRLAKQGLNIAGKFVEGAMSRAQGQGRGQNF